MTGSAPAESQSMQADEEDAVDWLKLLRNALVDEKAAPEILAYKHDVLEAVVSLVEEQVGSVERIQNDPELEMERILYERDLQRTRWIMKAYHRTRVRKIERHVQFYLHHDAYTQRLSPHELEFAKEFFTSVARHMQQTVLKDLPEHFQSFTFSSAAATEEDIIPAPNLRQNVLVRPVADSARISVSQAGGEDGTMVVYAGDVVVIQYNMIQSQLLREDVCLT